MAGYIDYARLRDEIFYDPNYDSDTINYFLGIIDAQPIADVAEVKHGEWIEKQIPLKWCEDDVDIVFECSVCKVESPFTSDNCPNCGAKMDGKNGSADVS